MIASLLRQRLSRAGISLSFARMFDEISPGA
jgi:hypothetical protein